jgi:phage shock protein C
MTQVHPPPPAARRPDGDADTWLDDLQEEAREAPRAASQRPLRRSRDDRVIAGVCGGLGAYLGIDPVLLRIAFVVLTIGAGSGILLYLIGWIAIPVEQPETEPVERPAVSTVSARMIVGGALVLLGAVLLMRRVLPWFDDRAIWPLILIAIGLLIATRGGRR